jgi:hypothetical protein
MKYMMLFWVDESAEATADEDAAMMVAVKSWVDQMTERGVLVHGGALRSAGEAAIVHVRDGEVLVSDGPLTPETADKSPGRASRSERLEYKRGKVRFAGHAEREQARGARRGSRRAGYRTAGHRGRLPGGHRHVGRPG